MTTIYKEEMFDRLYNYFSNLSNSTFTTYDGFIKSPQAAIILNHYNNDPYAATFGVLLNTGKFSANDVIKYDGLIRGWKSKLMSILNKIVSNPLPEHFLSVSNDILKAAITEYYPYGKSPVDVPDYVTNIYLDGVSPEMLKGINSYLQEKQNGNSIIQPEQVYDIFNFSIENTKRSIEESKQNYLNLTPIEFYNMCAENPKLLNNLALFKDPDFMQLMSIKFNQGQMEFSAKHSIVGSTKTETMDDLYNEQRLQCGVDDEPVYEKIAEYIYPTIEPNVKNAILEAFQNKQNQLQIQMESEVSSNPELWKILAGAGGVTLLGAGAYAGYKWWQNRKLQQEKERKRDELERQHAEEMKAIKEQLNDVENKSRKRQTVINNVVRTKPMDFDI